MFVFVSLLQAGVTIPIGLASTIIPSNDNDPDSIPGSVFMRLPKAGVIIPIGLASTMLEAIPVEIVMSLAQCLNLFRQKNERAF